MDSSNCYGSANRMLRKAMREYGLSDTDAFGGGLDALLTGLKTAGHGVKAWVKANPDATAEIAAAGVSLTTGAKQTEKRGRSTTGKANVAKHRSTTPNDSLVSSIAQYVGEYTTMSGEMRRQLTAQGVLDPNAQTEIVRNAFVAELYDSPPADTHKRNTLKALVSRMDVNLQKAYVAKSHG